MPLLLLLLLCASQFGYALSFNQESGDNFLPSNQAFKYQVQTDSDGLKVTWQIAPGYYLYEKSLALDVESESKALQLGKKQISPAGQAKHDEFMGDVIVHFDIVELLRPVTMLNTQQATITIQYQGCASAGLCYPPETVQETVDLTEGQVAKADSVKSKAIVAQTGDKQRAKRSKDQSKEQQPALNWWSLSLYFLLGVGLAFTPCVLPMLPILSSIIIADPNANRKRAFTLSCAYVIGMAMVYTLAGVLVALSGARLQIWMQQSEVLWVIAGLFTVLAVSLFGAFELQLPAGLAQRLQRTQNKLPGGRYLSVFIVGGLSAAVVSPCVSAPLAGILLHIGQRGEILWGALALLSLALGMGMPLIVASTFGAHFLPSAGQWMQLVKHLLGVLMLAMALYLIKHLLPTPIAWASFGIVLGLAGLMFEPFATRPSQQSILRTFSGLFGFALLCWSAFAFQHVWQLTFNTQATSSNQSTQLQMQQTTTLGGLQEQLQLAKQLQRPAMVDVYADWCTACLELEHRTFTDANVQRRLSDFQLIRLDLTEPSNAKAVLDHFEIVGPPALLWFDQHGNELKKQRINGFVSAAELLGHIETLAL